MMKRRNVELLVAAILLLAIAWLVRPSGQGFLLGGIQVNEPDHAHWIERLQASGMNTVAVTVYAKQGDWDTANLWWEEEEPWVVAEIRAAKAEGLEVVLVLRVALDHAFERNKFFWHGMIMPSTEAELEEWFRRYRQFVGKWARIAEDEGVGVLAVGSEMNALASTERVDEMPVLEEYWSNEEKVERETQKVLRHSKRIDQKHLKVRGFDNSASLEEHLGSEAEAHAEWARRLAFVGEEDALGRVNARRAELEQQWVAVVQEARQEFSRRLTYAANFDQYEMVSFWGELDLISINAYFPLRKIWQPGVTPEELYPVFEKRWEAILRSIQDLSIRSGREDLPLLFTELGYVYRADCTIEPWASTGFSVLPAVTGEKVIVWEDQPIDLEERAMAVRALYEANRTVGGPLTGILYWKLSTQPYHFDDEPFVLIVHEDARDPMLPELQRFGHWSPWGEAKRRLGLSAD